MDKKTKKILKRIETIKKELLKITIMRPGSLTCQEAKTTNKKYYQISYTHKMKSKTEGVKAKNVSELKRQIAAYKKFKQLTQEWLDLAIEYSKLKINLEKDR